MGPACLPKSKLKLFLDERTKSQEIKDARQELAFCLKDITNKGHQGVSATAYERDFLVVEVTHDNHFQKLDRSTSSDQMVLIYATYQLMHACS
jgi:hypothetical protein